MLRSPCALSAAITADLAMEGDVVAAVHETKLFVTAAIRTNPNLGRGYGPLNLFAEPGDAKHL